MGEDYCVKEDICMYYVFDSLSHEKYEFIRYVHLCSFVL